MVSEGPAKDFRPTYRGQFCLNSLRYLNIRELHCYTVFADDRGAESTRAVAGNDGPGHHVLDGDSIGEWFTKLIFI